MKRLSAAALCLSCLCAHAATQQVLVLTAGDLDYGARPLRRVIQDMVEDKLSDGLLRGKYQTGDTAIVDLEEEEIVVHPAAVAALRGDDSV